MPSRVKELQALGRITPPSWLPDNVMYETVMGSVAYGVAGEQSDFDVYGFCIPPKEDLFPHLRGEIQGFGRQRKRFEQYQKHHVPGAGTTGSAEEYDLAIYSIVKYFQLCMDNNPNMVDSLFTPRRCVLHATRVAERVREQRKLFLHAGCWVKFKGYAYAQLTKMGSKDRQGKRKETVEEHGYDVKFAYHVVRLLNEVEQILESGDLVLDREDSREQLKAIRAGEWTEEQVREYFTRKEPQLEEAYRNTKLPREPDEAALKALLLECLEEHYGSLEGAVHDESVTLTALRDIQAIVARTLK
ncbi:MAG: nucleotidyltransferase domain-containing protein [Acidobacteriota bacterium]